MKTLYSLHGSSPVINIQGSNIGEVHVNVQGEHGPSPIVNIRDSNIGEAHVNVQGKHGSSPVVNIRDSNIGEAHVNVQETMPKNQSGNIWVKLLAFLKKNWLSLLTLLQLML